MLISVMAIATLRIELISKNIFTKSYNNINQNIKDTINIGDYKDIMSMQSILNIKEDLVQINGKDVKFLQISLKDNSVGSYSRFRMFYER